MLAIPAKRRELFHIYFRFYRLLKPYWKESIFICLMMTFGLVLQFPGPLIVRHMLDHVIPEQNLELMLWLALALFGIAVLKVGSGYFNSIFRARNKAEITLYIRKLLFGKVLHARMIFFDGEHAGYIKTRIDDDVDRVDQFFFDTVLIVVLQSLTLIGGLIISLYINVKLTLLGCLAALPYFLIQKQFSRRLYVQSHVNQELWARFQGFLTELVSMMPTIKSQKQEPMIRQNFTNNLFEAVHSSREIENTEAQFNALVGLVTSLAPLAVLMLGIFEIVSGRFTVGGLIAFSANIVYIFNPIQSLISMNVNMNSALASANRVFEILDLEDEAGQFGQDDLTDIQTISFDDVSFIYDENQRRGLKSTMFRLSRGEAVCIVGSSGVGKSTIGKLLIGLNTPTSGVISFNGKAYQKYRIQEIRQRIGYVAQEPRLFSGSIYDNLLLANPEATEKQMNQVLAWCALDRWIASLPQGIHTSIHEAGAGVSGGEKQRIAIAQALLKQTDFLILDEVTSALDAETEKAVVSNLAHLPWRPGIIHISHRKTVVEMFSKVVEIC